MASRDFESDSYLRVPDWWSRLLSLGALAIAAAALYLAYQVYQEKRDFDDNDSALVKSAVQAGIQDIQKEASSQRARFDETLSSALVQVNRSVDEAFSRNERVTMKPSADLEEPLSQPETGNAVTKQDRSGNPTDAATTPLDQPTRAPARLVLTRSTLLARDLIERPSLSVRNEGESLASITAIRFVPSALIENVPKMEIPPWGSDAANGRMVVTFNDRHNDASAAGKIGIYSMQLNEPFTVLVDENIDLHLFIEHAEFAGFAVRGRLSLRYSTQDEWTFEDILIPFARPRSSSASESTEKEDSPLIRSL